MQWMLNTCFLRNEFGWTTGARDEFPVNAGYSSRIEGIPEGVKVGSHPQRGKSENQALVDFINLHQNF